MSDNQNKMTDEQKALIKKTLLNKKLNPEDVVEEIKLTNDLDEDDMVLIKSWTWEKMVEIFTDTWWDVLKEARDKNLTIRNLVAITGKDTRKTTVFLMFMWFLMNIFDWLNAYILRDTIVKAEKEMRDQVRKVIDYIDNEYGIEQLNDNVLENNDGFHLIRDGASKRNQRVGLLSFDSIIQIGGFTTANGYPAICIYDELQNPSSRDKNILTNRQFLANYKFIDTKLRGIEISSGKSLPKWIPRHYFLSNRYVGAFPLNSFAEEHFPFYDKYDDESEELIEKGVKTWMLEDPLNNNFIAKFVDENNVSEEWKDFSNTLIVYASKLSNKILRKDKEWEDAQIAMIKRGNEDDLAVIIGDLFEGYENVRPTYFYDRKTTILLDDYKNKYAKFAQEARLFIDLDFSRQIIIGGKYMLKIKDQYRMVRDKFSIIKCNGVSKDGAKTEYYLNLTWKKIVEYCVHIKRTMPQIEKVFIHLDDKKAQWVGRFNQGKYSNNFYKAVKIDFDQTWPIIDRPKIIDKFQDTGFIIDINHPTITRLHQFYKSSQAEPMTSKKGKILFKRVEKSNDPAIDFMNVDEYGCYYGISKFKMNLSKKNI